MTIPRPVGELPLWEAVMQTARHCCQCTGQCGQTHSKSRGRCEREHGAFASKRGGSVLLLAAPADPADMTLPAHKLAALPARRLAAWCTACHDGARTRVTKQACATAPPTPETDTLFAL